VAVPINAALNTLLMFGMFGFPELGLAGTGYATAFSFAVVAAMLLTKAFRVAGVSPRAALRGIDGRRVIALALSAIVTGFSLLCETGLYLASTLAVGRLLPEAIADHVIAFRVTAICYCIYFGFGQAVSMVQARAGNSGSAVAAAFACALGIGLAGGIAAFIAVGALADLSSHPGAAALPANAGMTLTALALAVVGLGVLRGRGEFRLAAIISAVAYWGAGFGTMAAFGWIGALDVSTIWLGLLAGTAATALGAWTAVLGPGVAALVRSRPPAEGEQATL
jgi:multidrug resistance protein, MATE family